MREQIDFILSRVTPKALAEPAPNSEQIDILLAAAESAPDYGRLKPWRFLKIAGQGREKLADLMLSCVLAKKPDLTASEKEQEKQKAFRAPLILAVWAHYQESLKVSRPEQRDAVAAAVQNIQLAAHTMGFGCHWRTGPFAKDPAFCKGLGMAEDDELVAVLYIGTVSTPAPARADLSSLVEQARTRLTAWD